ncbi:MAG: helix-turn-helix domain-containing protein, partial [Clostridiales bacterium]|nr:helix-turn-helix domain-containing protein [Clostridiales bacterium]
HYSRRKAECQYLFVKKPSCCYGAERRGLMSFSERLREKRLEANITQEALAQKVGVSVRTIQNYELGTGKPGNMETVQKIADTLNTTTEYLLGSTGAYVVKAHEKGGAKAARDIEELVGEVTELFVGGELSGDALDGAMKALNDAYWIAKEKNKKYAPKRKRASSKK